MKWPILDGHRHCELCHIEAPDVYEDGCCCCYIHRMHGGRFSGPTIPRMKPNSGIA